MFVLLQVRHGKFATEAEGATDSATVEGALAGFVQYCAAADDGEPAGVPGARPRIWCIWRSPTKEVRTSPRRRSAPATLAWRRRYAGPAGPSRAAAAASPPTAIARAPATTRRPSPWRSRCHSRVMWRLRPQALPSDATPFAFAVPFVVRLVYGGMAPNDNGSAAQWSVILTTATTPLLDKARKRLLVATQRIKVEDQKKVDGDNKM